MTGVKEQIPVEKLEVCERSEDNNDEDEIQSFDDCGFFCWQPFWLKKFSKLWILILFHGLASLAMIMSWSYFGSIISTIEKRFSVSSKTVASLMVISDISTLLFSSFIGYFLGNRHRPRFIGISTILFGVCQYLLVSPHLVYGPKKIQFGSEISIDSSGTETSFDIFSTNKTFVQNSTSYSDQCSEEDDLGTSSIVSLSLMALGIFLANIFGVVHHILATTYIDDNLPKKVSSIYYGVLMCIKWIGMLIGYLLGAYTLTIYQDLGDGHGLTQRSEKWVGAWWLGYIIISIPCFIFGFFISMFPKEVKKLKPKLPEEGKMLTNFAGFETLEKQVDNTPKSSWSAFPKRVEKLIKNRVLVFETLGEFCFIFSLYGIFIFNSKYMELQYNTTASQANLTNGISSVAAQCVGLFIGGIVVKMYKPGPRKLLIYSTTVALLSSAVMILLMTARCDNLVLSNVNLDPQFASDCNSDYECDTNQYIPVCDVQNSISYFSPCNLGCETVEEIDGVKTYADCSCLPNNTNGTLTSGRCVVDCKSSQYLYLGTLAILMVLNGTTSVGLLMLSLRAVDKVDKSFANGLKATFMSLTVFIPSPLVYGSILDSSCRVWDEKCGSRLNCIVYDIDATRIRLFSMNAVLYFLSAVFQAIAAYYGNRIKGFYDDDNVKGYQ